MKQKSTNALKRAANKRLPPKLKVKGMAKTPNRFASIGGDIPAQSVASERISLNSFNKTET